MVQYITIMAGSGHSSHCLCTVTVMLYVNRKLLILLSLSLRERF